MKRIAAISLSVALAIMTAACGNTQEPVAESSVTVESIAESQAAESETVQSEESSEAESAAESSEEAALFPVTVTDQMGREVTFEKAPERIVSGYYISTSTLIGLGLEDKMVGVEAKADKRPLYKLSAPGLLELPSVGTLKEFDLETTVAQNPELVVLSVKQKGNVAALEELGIPVLVVNPETKEDLNGMITLLGQMAGVPERAEEMIAFGEKQEKMIADAVSGEEVPTVYLAGNSALLSTAGSAMFQSVMIEKAFGTNVAAELEDTYWAEISYEQLLVWNPEYIVLASDASYTVEDVINDENLASLTAVQNGNVVKLPSAAESWDSPVPASVLGTVWLASRIHGDKFSAEQYEAAAKEYYETFYGFTYSEN